MDLLIAAEHLYRYHGDLCAVWDLHFSLRQGEVLGLLGPNGAGKSTSLQMLSGVLAPSAGRIRILGHDLSAQARQAKAALGFLPEHPPLYAELRVDEYLRYCAGIRGVERHSLDDAVELAKQRCGLAEAGARRIGVLSKGYQQRVGIAQAIVHRPALVILDEPTVGLDPNQMREIRELIRGLGQAHAVILSTHLLPEVQASCTRVLILHQGKTVFASPLDALQEAGRGCNLIVELEHPPAMGKLDSITGVERAESLGTGRFRLVSKPDADPRTTVAKEAVASGWGLVELRREAGNLERIFLDLTAGETT